MLLLRFLVAPRRLARSNAPSSNQQWAASSRRQLGLAVCYLLRREHHLQTLEPHGYGNDVRFRS